MKICQSLKARIWCLFLISMAMISTYAQTITVTTTVKGKTPTYMGFNPGAAGGYDDGRNYGDSAVYGTHAFWLKQTYCNMLRFWMNARAEEGSIDVIDGWSANVNDNQPEGNGVVDQASFDAARAAVIANPENNNYMVWDKFNHLRLLQIQEEKSLRIEPLQVLRHKHGGGDNFPTYMGGFGVDAALRDPGLAQFGHQWEWWEMCFAISYLNAKHCGATFFELGNEPEYGNQGGLSVAQQVHVARIGANAARAGVMAAIGQNAYIMACGSNMEDYATAMKDSLNDVLDVISVHNYESSGAAHFNHLKELLAASGTKPVIISEQGADANITDPYETGKALFSYLTLADERLNGVLLFRSTSSIGDGNAIMLANVKPGLFKPMLGYYVIRMMYRAGVNRKDVWTTSSTDSLLTCLVTKDAHKTFITIQNAASAAKTYTISLPAAVAQTRQDVLLFDGQGFLDAPWTGVTQNGPTITVTAQPAKSYVQIVYGATPLNPVPAQYDENQFTLTSLAQLYLPSSVGSAVQTYQSDFTYTELTPKSPDVADWICRSYLRNDSVNNTARGWLFNNRLYMGRAEWRADADGVLDVLWSHRRFSAVNGTTTISFDQGVDQTNGNSTPAVMVIYRDDNGAMISTRAAPNTQNDRYSLYAFDNPGTPWVIADKTVSGKLWSSSVQGQSLKAQQRLTLTITGTTINLQVYDLPGNTLSFASGPVVHNQTLSGIGRLGFARRDKAPIWFDNLVVNSDHTEVRPVDHVADAIDLIRQTSHGISITLSVIPARTVRLWSADGKRVLVMDNAKGTISLSTSNLAQGLYFLTIERSRTTATRKVFVIE